MNREHCPGMRGTGWGAPPSALPRHAGQRPRFARETLPADTPGTLPLTRPPLADARTRLEPVDLEHDLDVGRGARASACGVVDRSGPARVTRRPSHSAVGGRAGPARRPRSGSRFRRSAPSRTRRRSRAPSSRLRLAEVDLLGRGRRAETPGQARRSRSARASSIAPSTSGGDAGALDDHVGGLAPAAPSRPPVVVVRP